MRSATRSALRLGVLVASLAGLRPALAEDAPGDKTGDQAIAQAIGYIDQQRIDEAQQLLAPLAARGATTGLEHFALGELAYYQGKYVAAAEHLRLATELPPALVEDAKLLADLAERTAQVTKNFAEARSEHFVVRYPPGKDAILVPYALDALEKTHAALGADFGDRPTSPVLVEIYSEVADLARVSPLTIKEIETSGTIALCKWNRLMITSPRALVFGYPWLDTLNHEYSHFIISRVSRDTVPIWLHEGIAKFEEQRWRRPPGARLSPTMEHLLATALEKKRLIPFSAMHPSMAKLPSQEDAGLAFAEVFTFVEFLHQRRGYEGLQKLVAKLRESKRLTDGDAAVKAVFGKNLAALQDEWRVWLGQKHLRKHGEIDPLAGKLRFRHDKSKGSADDGEEDDSGQVRQDKARRFARLGGLLRARGRTKAAVAEYEKAMALLPAGSMPVAGKLGRSYLELGDADRAIKVTQPAVELYPDLGGPIAVMASAHLAKGNTAEASRYLEMAISLNPFDPQVHCGLAKLYREQKDEAKAAREESACTTLKGK